MLFLFDLDGTLADSLVDLREATEYALKKMNHSGYPLERYQYFVGNGVKKLLQRAFDTNDEKIYQEARKNFDTYYKEHCLDHTVAYPGLYQLTLTLRQNGHYLGVITNKPDELAKKICYGLFPDTFHFVQGQIDSVPVKPNPHFVLEAMQRYGFNEDNTFFIGDSNVDILTGQNAHIKTIGVTWGNRTEEELIEAGATYIVHNEHELAGLMEKVTHDCL